MIEKQSMSCSDFHSRLHHHLDRAHLGSGSLLLDPHLVGCPDCQALAAAALRLEEGLRKSPLSNPPAELGRRITRRVLAERPRAFSVRPRLLISGSLAP